jgi:hypothetical protein
MRAASPASSSMWPAHGNRIGLEFWFSFRSVLLRSPAPAVTGGVPWILFLCLWSKVLLCVPKKKKNKFNVALACAARPSGIWMLLPYAYQFPRGWRFSSVFSFVELEMTMNHWPWITCTEHELQNKSLGTLWGFGHKSLCLQRVRADFMIPGQMSDTWVMYQWGGFTI